LYAVIETGGKQYRVTEGDVLFLERLNGEPGESVRFDKILACSSEAENDFGKPYLNDVSVDAKILGHGKNKKIIIFKYKSKKGYRKKQGHRQPYTKIRIEQIKSEKFGVATYVEEEADIETVGADEDIDVIETADDTDDNGVEDIDDLDADGDDDIEDLDIEGDADTDGYSDIESDEDIGGDSDIDGGDDTGGDLDDDGDADAGGETITVDYDDDAGMTEDADYIEAEVAEDVEIIDVVDMADIVDVDDVSDVGDAENGIDASDDDAID
jgi:large subunit ribosomal protein L21